MSSWRRPSRVSLLGKTSRLYYGNNLAAKNAPAGSVLGPTTTTYQQTGYIRVDVVAPPCGYTRNAFNDGLTRNKTEVQPRQFHVRSVALDIASILHHSAPFSRLLHLETIMTTNEMIRIFRVGLETVRNW